jgi:hypothetical protein
MGALAVAMAVTALAASGITPLAPKDGSSVPSGASPTFRMRVHGSGAVWVRVCGSAHRTNGVICATDALGRATRGKGGVATFRPRFHDFPSFWLNNPGTYYWQAYRIACEGARCRQAGPVVAFTVQ